LICLPYYLKLLTLFVVFMGGWLGYEMAGFVFGDTYFLCVDVLLLHALFLCDLCHFSLLMVFLLVFDSGWIEYFGGRVYIGFFLISVRLVSGFNIMI
jgi:hypothetical protein